MSRTNRRITQISITAIAVLGLGVAVPVLNAAADASPAATCVQADNVWVLVQFDDETKGGCATEFGDGLEALASAGFEAVASEAGFVNTVDGEPAVRGPEDWWAYASSGEANDTWSFYEVGAKDSKPLAGSIEGWRLIHSYAAEETLPSTTPADLLADVEATVTPSPSLTQPAASPSPSLTQPAASPIPSEDDGFTTPIATARPNPAPPKTGN